MGSTLKGTISLLMNKTCILNFLNEFRELFDQGIPGYMDDMLDSSNPNTAFERRAQYIRGNRALDLIGHFHCDVFNQNKF